MPSTPSIADLYENIRTTSDPLNPDIVRGMSNQLKWQSVLAALGAKTPRQGSVDLSRWILDHNVFPLQYFVQNPEGQPDFIFSNHQGPGEERDQKSDEKKGMGILDTSLSPGIDPLGTRTVLKDEIVQFRRPKSEPSSIMKAITHAIRAQICRRANPIPLKRPSKEEFKQNHKTAAKRLREECKRVWEECCRIANAPTHTTVKIYAEGTRSADGNVKAISKGLCPVLIQNYIQPKLQSHQEPDMELEIVDTLQTFPDGLGSGIPAYNRPLTINRYTYNPDASLMTDIGEWNGDTSELRALGLALAKDMRGQMEQLLRGIIMQSVETT